MESIQYAKPVKVEDIADEISSLPSKIRSGQAYLKVTAYPWGVEFDVLEGGQASWL